VASEESARLHELVVLLRAAPEACLAGLRLPETAPFEALINAGGALSAVAALFDGGDAGYLLSCSSAGQFLASVVLPGAQEEVSASGESAALALICAMSIALSERSDVARAASGMRAPPGLRLN
jgi:hypothetical protein